MPRPRVAIDARMIGHTGIGRLLRTFINGLAARSDDFSLLLILNPTEDPTAAWEWLSVPKEQLDRIELVSFGQPIPIYSAAEQAWLPKVLNEKSVDLLFAPHFNIPLLSSVPLVCYLHDAIYLLEPSAAPSWLRRKASGFLMRRAVKRAHTILTSTKAAAAQIEAALGLPASDCVLAPPDASEMIHWIRQVRRGGQEMIHPRVRALDKYILCVGTHLPHKNLRFALEVLKALRPLGFPSLKLAIAGPEGRGTPDLQKSIEELELKDQVEVLGAVEDRDLAWLYDHALALLAPSRIEGFGLPLLEAMAAECPIVASDIPAHRELAHNVAVLHKLDDLNAFAASLARLQLQPAEGQRITRLGLERLKDFNAVRSCAILADVFQAALSQKSKS